MQTYKVIKKHSEGGSYPLRDLAEFVAHKTTFQAWPPSRDETGRIAYVKPLNSGLAYGITHEGKFALCETGTLTDWVRSIHSEHDTAEAMRWAFFDEQAARRACY